MVLEPVSAGIELGRTVVFDLAGRALELTQIAKQKGKKCGLFENRLKSVKQIIYSGIVQGVSNEAVEDLRATLENVILALEALTTERKKWRRRVVVFLNGRQLTDALQQADFELNSAISAFIAHQTNQIIQILGNSSNDPNNDNSVPSHRSLDSSQVDLGYPPLETSPNNHPEDEEPRLDNSQNNDHQDPHLRTSQNNHSEQPRLGNPQRNDPQGPHLNTVENNDPEDPQLHTSHNDVKDPGNKCYFCWKNPKLVDTIVVVVICLLLASGIVVTSLFSFGVIEKKQPAGTSTLSPTFQDTQETTVPSTTTTEEEDYTVNLNACQIKIGCSGDHIGIPVTGNGKDFKQVLHDYLTNPKSSPHGSNINCWDVSQVTDMSYAFAYSWSTADTMYDPNLGASVFEVFNEPLFCWDTSNVITMQGMFYGTNAFDQDLDVWDVSKVTDFSLMFSKTMSFDGNIQNWYVPKARDMNHMFANAKAFNQDISSWNVTSVTNMHSMFEGATSFNQSMCLWNNLVSVPEINVEDMFQDSGCDDNFDPTSVSWCQLCATT